MRLCPACRAPHRDAAECSFDQTPLAPEEEDLLAGAVAGGRFHLVERISEDPEGPVYRAAAEPALTEVHVQVLFAERCAAPEDRAARLRELSAAGALPGRWLQRVLGSGPLAAEAPSGPLFVAVEPPAPRSAAAELGQGAGGLEEPRALRICRRVAAALAHAHERGLAHGALAAAQVRLRDEDGEADAVQLCGRFLPAPSDDAFAADLRALGALLFQLLTGSAPPRPGPVPIREVSTSAEVSFAVERLVQRLLDRAPDAALSTARGVMRALDEAGARGAVEVSRGSESRPVLPEVPEAVARAMSLALQRAGAAAARGQADGAKEALLSAVREVADQVGAEAVAARLLAAGEDALE
ncbi:MAG TPA: hypothetical protein VND93_29520, partial [Myxococcales bacterium]|nr:hypothetical protein [Myxococcales bacterium]